MPKPIDNRTPLQIVDDNINAMNTNPSCSFWLKEALKSSLKRDCVDALRDAQILSGILRARCSAIFASNKGGVKC